MYLGREGTIKVKDTGILNPTYKALTVSGHSTNTTIEISEQIRDLGSNSEVHRSRARLLQHCHSNYNMPV